MEYTAALWVNALCLAMCLGLIGMVVSVLFGTTFVGRILAVLAILAVVYTSIFTGAFLALYALERGEIVHVEDGRNDFFITLHFGPFIIKRVLPWHKAEGGDQEARQ
jgi:hypothetical protein